MQGDQAGEQRVLDALGDLVVRRESTIASLVIRWPTLRTNSRLRPGSVSSSPSRGGVGAVGVEHPGEGLAALADLLGEVAPVQAQPVAVAEHLVVGVDGGHRVLEVHDRGDRGLQDDVLDAGLVGRADGGVGVDQDLDVQAVVDQQHRPARGAELAAVAGELLRAGQPGRLVADGDLQLTVVDAQARDVGPRTRRQRGGLIEEPARVGDHQVAAHPVVAVALLGAVGLRNDVGAVQRVVQRAPARIGGVQREPRVEHRHHQLRAGGRGDLRVDARRGDGEVGGLGQQVADLGEEGLVCLGIVRFEDAVPVPLVDLGLQLVAPGQQLLVLRCQIGHHLVHTRPEGVGVDAGAGQRLVADEVVQHLGDAQVAHDDAVCHVSSWCARLGWQSVNPTGR